VDELGGLEAALAEAQKLAALDEYRVTEYPKVKDPFQQFMEKWLDLPTAKASATKQAMLKEEMGELYPYYQHLKQMQEGYCCFRP